MGHFCRICQRTKPNEMFTGKGHRIHVCKDCAGLQKTKRQEIEDESFLYDVFYRQSNISKGNIQYLNKIAERHVDEISEKARVIAEVGRLHPQKKKRIGHLYSKHRELFNSLVQLRIMDDEITPRIQDELECDKEAEQWEITNSSKDIAGKQEPILFPSAKYDEELPF